MSSPSPDPDDYCTVIKCFWRMKLAKLDKDLSREISQLHEAYSRKVSQINAYYSSLLADSATSTSAATPSPSSLPVQHFHQFNNSVNTPSVKRKSSAQTPPDAKTDVSACHCCQCVSLPICVRISYILTFLFCLS